MTENALNGNMGIIYSHIPNIQNTLIFTGIAELKVVGVKFLR